MEVWKDIYGYEGLYKISNYGRVKSFIANNGNRTIIKTPGRTKTGYLFTPLYSNSKFEQFYIHRLVASHFIENIEGKREVNHKDGDKSNNHIDNLEWVTSSENKKHAWRTGLSTKTCGQLVLNEETGIYYESVMKAAKVTNIHHSNLRMMLLGKYRNRTSMKLV